MDEGGFTGRASREGRREDPLQETEARECRLSGWNTASLKGVRVSGTKEKSQTVTPKQRYETGDICANDQDDQKSGPRANKVRGIFRICWAGSPIVEPWSVAADPPARPPGSSVLVFLNPKSRMFSALEGAVPVFRRLLLSTPA